MFSVHKDGHAKKVVRQLNQIECSAKEIRKKSTHKNKSSYFYSSTQGLQYIDWCSNTNQLHKFPNQVQEHHFHKLNKKCEQDEENQVFFFVVTNSLFWKSGLRTYFYDHKLRLWLNYQCTQQKTTWRRFGDKRNLEFQKRIGSIQKKCSSWCKGKTLYCY